MNPEKNLQPAERVYEPEIVGLPKKHSRIRGWFSRLMTIVTVAAVGAVFIITGVLLTITVVGGLLGIPMIFVGLLMELAAGLMFFAGSGTAVIRFGGSGRKGTR
jgi:hypothetical protein